MNGYEIDKKLCSFLGHIGMFGQHNEYGLETPIMLKSNFEKYADIDISGDKQYNSSN